MGKYRGYLILTLIYAVVLGGVLMWRQPEPAPITIVEPSPRPTRTPARLVVHVSGAVLRPGVYTLAEGSRWQDALQAAGGPAPEADAEALNLAAPVTDGQRVHVPRQGEAAPPPSGALPGSGPLNINTASAAEMENLPGVGPVLAQRIVEDRQANGPFQSVEQLARVRGVGPALLEKLKGLIVAR